MKQSRDPKGSGHPVPAPTPAHTAEHPDDSSDLVELKAIAASMRAGATPRSTITASELSGVVPRHNSVVGARFDQYGPLAGVPPWFWGVVGCLGVMAVGLGVFWYLTGPVGSATASTSQALRASPPAGAAATQGPEIVPMEPPSRPEPVEHVESSPVEKAPGRRAGIGSGTSKAARGEAAAAAPEAPASPEPALVPAVKRSEIDSVLAKALDGEPGDAPRKAPAARAGNESTDNQPDRALKEVDAALDDLQPKVRQCFHRFQIRGVAQVNLTVTPAGSVQSSALTGDFEGTPTGECVIKELASATLPPFKGGPVKISHQYIFR